MQKKVRDIRRATRCHYSAEKKICIVLKDLQGEDSIAGLCEREGINRNLYYRWSKEFLKAARSHIAYPVTIIEPNKEIKTLNSISYSEKIRP